MCTAVLWQNCFGRTLDLEYSYREQVTVMPRNFPIFFRRAGKLERHHAIIGVAHIEEEYPLYYDGGNEHGLAMAGLNFPGNARYALEQTGRDNVAPFELILWVLGQCATVDEAEVLLKRVNLVDLPFSKNLPLTPLHWMIADKDRAIVAEPMAEGLKLHPNPAAVLANNPPFPEQLTHLANYRNLTPEEAESRFSPRLELKPHSRGMGAIGLPGDWSSSSRFVRAAFIKENALPGQSERENISQFFHILSGVEQSRGSVRLSDGKVVETVYTSCCDLSRRIYYYTTYGNRQISGVDLHREDLESDQLAAYPLLREEQIRMER